MSTKITLAILTGLFAFLVEVLRYSKPVLAALAAVNPLLAMGCYVLLVILCLLVVAFLLLGSALRK
jgi:hypothetical protein